MRRHVCKNLLDDVDRFGVATDLRPAAPSLMLGTIPAGGAPHANVAILKIDLVAVTGRDGHARVCLLRPASPSPEMLTVGRLHLVVDAPGSRVAELVEKCLPRGSPRGYHSKSLGRVGPKKKKKKACTLR